MGACWYQPHSGWNYLHLCMLSQIQLRNFTDFNRKPFKTRNFVLWPLETLVFFFKNKHVENVFNFLLRWRLHSFYITWSFLYIPVKISMIHVFCVTFLHRKAEIWNQFGFFSKIWKDFFFISFFNTINSGLKKMEK